jgi:hypothetical protein
MTLSTGARVHTTLRLARRVEPARGALLELDALARQAGLHPDLVRRFVALGLVEPSRTDEVPPRFAPEAAAQLARAARLRRDLGVNYAGAILASELLARIDELELRLRRYEPPRIDRTR